MGEYGVITPNIGTENSSKISLCTPQVTPFLPYNIVDAAAIIVDNETGGDCSSIDTWDAETKTCTLTVDLDGTKCNNWK